MIDNSNNYKIGSVYMIDNSKEYDSVYNDGYYNVKSVYDHIVRIRMRYLNNIDGNLLDYGFGNGILCEYFTREGFNVYGVESSEIALKDLVSSAPQRDLKEQNYFLIGHSDSSIPFENDFFSVIISNQVLYFLQDRNQINSLIKDCFRVLKKGGKAVFTIMAEDNYFFTKYGISHYQSKA
jgi:SAM-dependent methyltransferase